jgi:hypothetical protein
MTRSRALVGLLFGLPLLGLPAGRLLLRADPPMPVAKPAKTADVFGYTAAFDAALAKVGQITPAEFARRYPGKAAYLQTLTWDPTTAKFWDKFTLDPNEAGAEVRIRGEEARRLLLRFDAKGKPIPPEKEPKKPAGGLYDFRPNKAELETFKRNGFVVSERMGAKSPTDLFYRIFERDLPVFVSSDALLHAWHRSYDAMLEEIETCFLSPTLADLFAGMAKRLPDARDAYGKGVLADSLTDADYFLTVGRSLLAGHRVASPLGQDDRVARTLAAQAALQLERIDLFGRDRRVDFSHFKPRGHYEKSEPLKRYFRAMMWCGTIDLRVAGNPKESSPRELGAAVVLHDLLHKSGKFEQWQRFDGMVQAFVGKADSMTFAQLAAVLADAGVKSPADLRDLDALTALQGRVAASKAGMQHVRGHPFKTSPWEPGRLDLPRSFTVLGQRFLLDSWVTAKVVYSDVLWEEQKVMRRVPSCLDVAFAALGNDAVVPNLVGRMTNPAGREFRDGLNYQHNLAAVRDVIDAHTDAAWKKNLYTGWLACLRELSAPTTDAKYPEAMRTRAWAMKTLNTQLASWTQLRHDTILYVKQSVSDEVTCSYPAGYVEPVPQFWGRLEQLARDGSALIGKTPYPVFEMTDRGQRFKVDAKGIQQQHANFLKHFADTVAKLRVIAEKELAQKEFSKEEVKFLEEVVQVSRGCGGPRRYTGWYPTLFYGADGEGSAKWDALVADVHTDFPAPPVRDPGCVLHQGVGNVDLLLIAIDNGKDRMVYAGPLLSHYEFEMAGVARKSDSEWRADLNAGRVPPRPAWTRGYLVPGVNPEAKNYRAGP